jgi:hypothetical protein
LPTTARSPVVELPPTAGRVAVVEGRAALPVEVAGRVTDVAGRVANLSVTLSISPEGRLKELPEATDAVGRDAPPPVTFDEGLLTLLPPILEEGLPEPPLVILLEGLLAPPALFN